MEEEEANLDLLPQNTQTHTHTNTNTNTRTHKPTHKMTDTSSQLSEEKVSHAGS
jgi:hypothetical protein